jgi:protocatechuate 3,4-dioxygenase beta subunit
MNRKNFLRGIGLTAVGLSVPYSKVVAMDKEPALADPCVLLPTEIAGPFPLDLTDNNFYFRKDIREGKTGAKLNLKLKVTNTSNCTPMKNVRINIWQCDKDGDYSGYTDFNTQGATFLRGYQITDANGIVDFTTILPGWYLDRVCHIHIQVFVSTAYAVVSQFTFPEKAKNDIYLANKTLYTKGIDPQPISTDLSFDDGFDHQLATLTPNNTSVGGFDSYLEISVDGGTTLGVGHIERQNAKQFSLGQNYPNPYVLQTIIPFTLKKNSQVKIVIWDLTGRNLGTILDSTMNAGAHEVIFNPTSLRIPTGNYIYQFETKNEDGVFKDAKMMTSN